MEALNAASGEPHRRSYHTLTPHVPFAQSRWHLLLLADLKCPPLSIRPSLYAISLCKVRRAGLAPDFSWTSLNCLHKRDRSSQTPQASQPSDVWQPEEVPKAAFPDTQGCTEAVQEMYFYCGLTPCASHTSDCAGINVERLSSRPKWRTRPIHRNEGLTFTRT